MHGTHANPSPRVKSSVGGSKTDDGEEGSSRQPKKCIFLFPDASKLKTVDGWGGGLENIPAKKFSKIGCLGLLLF